MNQIKSFIKRSKSAIIAYKIYDNWRTVQSFRRGEIELDASSHLAMTLSQSLDYINAQFSDYLHYGQVTIDSLRDKRVFELGFGDSVGVALKFLAVCGVKQVVCLDKFYCKRDDEQQREIYQALRGSLKSDERERFDDAIDLKNGLQLNPERLVCIYGTNVEDCQELVEGQSFDLIVSRGAIQDIYEPDAAIAAMDKMLSKGGSMLHKIDLSDQGMFRDNDLHPLTFLTISDRLYRMMASGSGKPNRKLLNYYREQLENRGYDTTILITDLIGRKGMGDLHPHKEGLEIDDEFTQNAFRLLEEIRPRLLPRFRKLSDLELIVSGIFVVARKAV
jgi:hypothetical protein